MKHCTCHASGGYLKGNGPDPARCPVHGSARKGQYIPNQCSDCREQGKACGR
jgi:hypothetical protein